MNNRNIGDKAMAIDLGQLPGTSSNRILTRKNPPEIDSMTCSNQTISLGTLPPARESNRLSRPQPFSRPMLASIMMNRAITVLRCPCDREEEKRRREEKKRRREEEKKRRREEEGPVSGMNGMKKIREEEKKRRVSFHLLS
jgi:hypothetical protein